MTLNYRMKGRSSAESYGLAATPVGLRLFTAKRMILSSTSRISLVDQSRSSLQLVARSWSTLDSIWQSQMKSKAQVTIALTRSSMKSIQAKKIQSSWQREDLNSASLRKDRLCNSLYQSTSRAHSRLTDKRSLKTITTSPFLRLPQQGRAHSLWLWLVFKDLIPQASRNQASNRSVARETIAVIADSTHLFPKRRSRWVTARTIA